MPLPRANPPPPPSRLRPRTIVQSTTEAREEEEQLVRLPSPRRTYNTGSKPLHHSHVPPPPPPRSLHVSAKESPQTQSRSFPLADAAKIRQQKLPPTMTSPKCIANQIIIPNTPSREDLETRSRDLLQKCLKHSMPSGNLLSGGLGAYYLLLEQSKYNLCMIEQQRQGPIAPACRLPLQQCTPFRCKRLLKQALEGAREAASRFRAASVSNVSNKKNCISLLGGDWVGSYALLAVCYRRLEDFQEDYQESEEFSNNGNHRDPPSPNTPRSVRSFRKAQAGEDDRFSSSISVSSQSVATHKTNSTLKKPRSERVADKILRRIRKQHCFSNENDDDDDMSIKSTLTCSALIWNQDVLGGRAGALQAIWWLRDEFCMHDLGQDLVVLLTLKILEEGLWTASSMGLDDILVESTDEPPRNRFLFWVCDTQGSHKAYLGAARGVVGILHTLLGLHDEDWELVEEEIPGARAFVRNSINAFLPSTSAKENRLGGNHTELPSLYERLFFGSRTPMSSTTACPHQKAGGNIRPTLDASPIHDTTVDWFRGATGLAMLFLEASKVFKDMKYLKEAHRLCDQIIYPRGLIEETTKARAGKRPKESVSRAVETDGKSNCNKSGPVGLATMAICFLKLSEQCSGISAEFDSHDTNKVSLPRNASLRELWRARAGLYAQEAYCEWERYIEVTPTNTGASNAFSLYYGMGSLISLMWQLSYASLGTDMGSNAQLPLFGTPILYGSPRSESEPSLLSPNDVTLMPTVLQKNIHPSSPRKSPRSKTSQSSHLQALSESRRRRSLAEAKAARQKAEAEEAARKKAEKEKAQRMEIINRRKVELEKRKKMQLLARKKAMEAARQKEEEDEKKAIEKAQRKSAEEKSKREVLLLARRQAAERVEARRRAKEAAALQKAKEEAQQEAIEMEKKRKLAEQEAKKRKALLQARLRRQEKEAELAKQREEEQKAKDSLERQRRIEELKHKERIRNQRLEEIKRRQVKAAKAAKIEAEKQRSFKEKQKREHREKELKQREERMKRLAEERKNRLAKTKERTTRKEKAKAHERAAENSEENPGECNRMKVTCPELESLLDNHAKNQQYLVEQNQEYIASSQETSPMPRPPHQTVYSPSFASKKTGNAAHFSTTTRSSLFWSLQTDSNIGSSEGYKPALIANESGGQIIAASEASSLSSSPQAFQAATHKNTQDSVASSSTLTTAPLSTLSS